jgi:hypothetical protein
MVAVRDRVAGSRREAEPATRLVSSVCDCDSICEHKKLVAAARARARMQSNVYHTNSRNLAKSRDGESLQSYVYNLAAAVLSTSTAGGGIVPPGWEQCEGISSLPAWLRGEQARPSAKPPQLGPVCRSLTEDHSRQVMMPRGRVDRLECRVERPPRPGPALRRGGARPSDGVGSESDLLTPGGVIAGMGGWEINTRRRSDGSGGTRRARGKGRAGCRGPAGRPLAP